jgi:predicted transcriptional regulator
MVEKHVVIAPVGDHLDALFIGIRDFPTERVILLTPKDKASDAKKVCNDLSKFKIPCQVENIKGHVWEEMFQKISEIAKAESGKNLIVNTATGDRMTTCAATSAAFVNGLKAMSVDGDESMMLPVLKFSYYKMLTDKKLELLKLLHKKDASSLDEIAKKMKMSLPLISYHINGNLKSEGLRDLGLVDTKNQQGKMSVKLSTLGRMLVKGYIN